MEGLTNKEVSKSRKKYGSNQISKLKKPSFLRVLIGMLGDPIIKILLIVLAIKIVFLFKDFDWFETIGIVIAIFLASFISTASEYGSEKAFEELQKEASQIKVRVKRNGQTVELNIDEIVVGDIVLLASGDKIPADGEILKGEILVDESLLNGETKEKLKNKMNKVYRSTVVYSGQAVMKCNQVGDKTFYGSLAQEIQEKASPSPLKLRLTELAKTISKIGYVGAGLVCFSYFFSVIFINNNFDLTLVLNTITNSAKMMTYFLHALTLSVTIIVVAVPEGLPMMITLVLSSNMKRMLKDHVLVRKLTGIEASGNVNILFTDKTGTLTKGSLEVVNVTDSFFNSYASEKQLLKNKNFYELIKLSILANNSSNYNEQGIPIGGNATDRSLLRFFKSNNLNYYQIDYLPFDSSRKYSAVKLLYNQKEVNLIKGAPEIILKNCTYAYDEMGKKIFFTKHKYLFEQIRNNTRKGYRVLALASTKEFNNLNQVVFIGLIYIKDEVRKEAVEGLKLVTQAGIKTAMITGDNVDTAVAVAKEIGLINKPYDIVLTSEELNYKTDEELRSILPNLKVLARALPQDKSRLVKIAQSINLVVGMTGDGVNDAPALKKADVGFAMGSGTEVAKEASEIVILNDNFLSIVNAILYGRTIFKSIRKFIIFQLTVNICAVGISIIGPFIGVDTPVTVVQMLWINMVMDTLAGIAFSFEPPLQEYMQEKPKKKSEKIINSYMREQILYTGLYSTILCVLFLKLPIFHNIFRYGANDEYLMTAFFGLFIFIGIFNSFNARTHRLNLLAHLFENKAFLIVIIFILFVQVFLIYFGGTLFRTYGLTFPEFNIMILLAATVIPFDFLRKKFLRKKGEVGGV